MYDTVAPRRFDRLRNSLSRATRRSSIGPDSSLVTLLARSCCNNISALRKDILTQTDSPSELAQQRNRAKMSDHNKRGTLVHRLALRECADSQRPPLQPSF